MSERSPANNWTYLGKPCPMTDQDKASLRRAFLEGKDQLINWESEHIKWTDDRSTRLSLIDICDEVERIEDELGREPYETMSKDRGWNIVCQCREEIDDLYNSAHSHGIPSDPIIIIRVYENTQGNAKDVMKLVAKNYDGTSTMLAKVEIGSASEFAEVTDDSAGFKTSIASILRNSDTSKNYVIILDENGRIDGVTFFCIPIDYWDEANDTWRRAVSS